MCLLVQQSASTKFSDEFILDVYSKNRDGIGVMYADSGIVQVHKYLPKKAAEFLRFYRDQIDGRDCIWHARMQTHGKIDMDNCHPYKVTDKLWMAHNGILSSGNESDTAKSDTWHFIRNVIEPVLAYEPDRLMRPEYQTFLGNLIGSTNKFGFMDGYGNAVIINRSSGVTYEGAWLSNTYAWSASKFGMGTASKGIYTKHWGSSYYSWDSGFSYDKETLGNGYDTNVSIKPVVRAAYNSWLNNALQHWVIQAPEKATRLISYWYEEDESSVDEMVYDEPVAAAELIADLFDKEGLTPSQL